ncbi:MAG: hypothetical protein BWY31_03380 [Lentisphaerae bacterium ADurb.Bin242]|nr:MAG: hypothetical protein BWY31_03380 [Lentisphaerae bacterium ADurb.Bin242]
MSNGTTYSPWNFPERFESGGIVVEYAGLGEVQQGSPLIGKLSVNGTTLPSRFGGPALIGRNAVFVPRYIQEAWKFELCRIAPETRAVTSLTPQQHVVWLDRIEGDVLYFYRDINRTALSEINLGTGALRLAEVKTEKMSFGEIAVGILQAPFVLLYCLSISLILLFSAGFYWAWSKLTGKQ